MEESSQVVKYKLFIIFSHSIIIGDLDFRRATGLNEPWIFASKTGAEITVDLVDLNDDPQKLELRIQVKFSYDIKENRYLSFKIAGDWINSESSKLSPTVKNFISENRDKWREEGRNILKLFQWRFDFRIDFSSVKETITYSLDDRNWLNIVHPLVRLTIHGTNYDGSSKYEDMQLLINNNIECPIAIDILEEAKRTIKSGFRSSFILMATALEVGIKHFIVSQRPAAQKQLLEIQSPPIEFLITVVIPEIEPFFKPSEKLIEEIKNIVGTRNKLIHSGHSNKSLLDFWHLTKYINIVSDILYLFSLLQGNSWASARIGYSAGFDGHQIKKLLETRASLIKNLPEGSWIFTQK